MSRMVSLFALIFLWFASPLSASAQVGDKSPPDIAARVFLAVAAAAALTIISIPYFYRRALARKKRRDLSAFLLSDPETRDLLISGRKDPEAEEKDSPGGTSSGT